MRNMRKALSFALILALVLTSFSFAGATHTGTGATELSDIAGLPGAEHIMAGHSLGYIIGFPDGSFRPNELVNRAQFAAFVTRAMGIPDSALLGHTATPFLDTDGFGWAVPYLAFTHSRGIMLGDGHGNAMPGRTITMNEGMTMLLRAIGYTEGSQELVGTWPANYVALATQHDLYRDIVGTSQHMDRQNAAIAIFNALTVQMVYVDLVGRTDRRWISHEQGIPANLANTGLNALTHRGVLHLDMTSMPHMNIADRVGAYGWIFADRHTGELIAFRQISTFVTGFLNAENTRFTAGGTSFSGNFTTSQGAIALFFNGEQTGVTGAQAQIPIRAIAGLAFPDQNTDGRQVTMAVEISGQTITRIHSINGWAADVARVVNAGDIRMINDYDSLLGLEFPLNLDQVIDYRMFQLIGVDCLRDIRADHVVYVYADEGDVITKVAVGTEVVEGQITASSDTSFTVDGTTLNYASRVLSGRTAHMATPFEVVSPAAGSDATVRLDAFGNAFDVVLDGQEIGNFGIVISGTGLNDPRGQGASIFTNDDAQVFYNIVGGNITQWPARVATVPAPRRGTANTAIRAEITNANALAPQLIGFGLNAQGSINVIEYAVQNATVDVRSRTVARLGGVDVTIDPNAAVFALVDGAWELFTVDDIDLAAMRAPANAALRDGQQYVLNVAGNRVAAFTVDEAFVDASGEYIFGVISTWSNIPGNAQNLVGFFDGAATSSTLRTADDVTPSPTRAIVAFWQLVPNAAGQIREFDAGSNLALAVNDRFISHPDNFAGAVRSTTAAVDGGFVHAVQVPERNQVDMTSNFIRLEGSNQVINVTGDVAVYRAQISGGNVGYTYSTAGLGAIPGNAWVWAFNTLGDGDVDNTAQVVIWMANGDFPAAWR